MNNGFIVKIPSNKTHQRDSLRSPLCWALLLLRARLPRPGIRPVTRTRQSSPIRLEVVDDAAIRWNFGWLNLDRPAVYSCWVVPRWRRTPSHQEGGSQHTDHCYRGQNPASPVQLPVGADVHSLHPSTSRSRSGLSGNCRRSSAMTFRASRFFPSSGRPQNHPMV